MAKGVTIPIELFESQAFRDLPPLEWRLIVELVAMQLDTRADGVKCSARWAAKVCGTSKSPAGRALLTLEERGFLVRIGGRGMSAPADAATIWRVTCLPYAGDPPTFDFLNDQLTWRSVKLKRSRQLRGVSFFTPEMEAEIAA